MSIWDWLILLLLLWIFMSLLVKKYLIRTFRLHNALACLLTSLIFIAIWVIMEGFVGFMCGMWSQLTLVGGVVAFLLATWVLFLVARSFIETEKWRVRENILFLSLILMYLSYVILLTVWSYIKPMIA
mgnify:CR=1 FL=1